MFDIGLPMVGFAIQKDIKVCLVQIVFRCFWTYTGYKKDFQGDVIQYKDKGTLDFGKFGRFPGPRTCHFFLPY